MSTKIAQCLGVLAVLALMACGKGGDTPAPTPPTAPVGEAPKPADPVEPDEAPEVATAPGAEVIALKAISTTIIRAFAAKDLTRLGEFAPAEAQAAIAEMKPGNPQFDELFDESKWRWKAANGWDGQVGGVRRDGDKAWVKFADLPDGELAVVRLRKVDGKWIFEDFGNPSRERWDGWGAEAK